MRAGALAGVLLAVAGCSSGVDHPTSAQPSDSSTSVHGKGPYEVGRQINPGVWISDPAQPGCSGTSASTPDAAPGDPASDDDLIAFSVRVGDVQRIELHKGEFFTSIRCSTWQLEDGSSPRTPDPTTRIGGCTLLVDGDHLVQRTLAYGHRSAGERDAFIGQELQDRLFALVVARNKPLWASAGQLVDYLDDPDAYNRGTGTSTRVTRAVDRIRSVCGHL